MLRGDFKSDRNELIISTKAGYDMWPGPYDVNEIIVRPAASTH